MEFTNKFKEKVKSGDQKFALAKEFGVSFYTITRWLNLKKSDSLTKLANIKVLTEFSGLTQDQIFTKEND